MSPITRQYYRVPRGDREVYIRPPVADLPGVVERNRRLISSYNFDLGGRPVGQFRAAARAEIMQLARAYAAKWGFAVDREWSEPAPIIVTGHQPPPFHPGVWIKNFLAGSLASAVVGVGLNLTVDTDEARGQVYRFPVRAAQARRLNEVDEGSAPAGLDHLAGRLGDRDERAAQARRLNDSDEIRVVEVPIAEAAPGVAYEEQPTCNSNTVRSFAERAKTYFKTFVETVKQLRPRAIYDAFVHWSHLLGPALGQTSSLAEALGVARRRLEEELGLRNLEVPVSHMSDTAAFRLFAAWMLAEHEQVFAAYNGALAEYRRVYRERSAAQPVPDLARDGGRIELPLWVWRPGQQRRRLWVESVGASGTRAQQAGRLTKLTLLAEREPITDFSGEDLADTGALAARLAALREAGWKIRPRALAMTLFVRLAVGDVFIHGLGGALYDKITDAMFERLWGVRPPELVLASCTVFLPLPAYPATPADLAAARRAVRDWRFNPDRKMSAATRQRPEVEALAGLKRQLIETMRAIDREDRRRAFQRIHEINEALARLEPDGPAAAGKELARIERELRYNAILRGREYPFCFYPAQELAAFYREETAVAPSKLGG